MAILEVFEKVKKQRKAAENKKALKNVAVGAALGVTVGAVAGVLLAPKSGKETREELAVATKDAVEKAKVKIEEVKEKTLEKVEEAKGQLKQKMESCHCGCEDATESEAVTTAPEVSAEVPSKK